MQRRTRLIAGVLGVVVVAAVGVGTFAGHSSSPAPAGQASATRTLTVASRSVTVDGRSRDSTLVTPTRPNGALLVVLPGLGETVAQVRTTSGADSLATAEGVTIAYLGGFQDSWNAGTCCGAAQAAGLDDVSLVRGVAQALVKQDKLDPHRVFVAGHSNGAFMALRLACQTQGVYAGFLSVAGALVVDCPDPSGTPVVFWQGAKDTTVPVAGGTVDGVALPALTTTLAPFTAACGQPVQSAADVSTALFTWTCPETGKRLLLLNETGTHDWPAPTGQLISDTWQVFSGLRASGGV